MVKLVDRKVGGIYSMIDRWQSRSLWVCTNVQPDPHALGLAEFYMLAAPDNRFARSGFSDWWASMGKAKYPKLPESKLRKAIRRIWNISKLIKES